MPETLEHRVIRSKGAEVPDDKIEMKDELEMTSLGPSKLDEIKDILPEHQHRARPTRSFLCQPTSLPSFLYCIGQKVTCNGRNL